MFRNVVASGSPAGVASHEIEGRRKVTVLRHAAVNGRCGSPYGLVNGRSMVNGYVSAVREEENMRRGRLLRRMMMMRMARAARMQRALRAMRAMRAVRMMRM